MTEDQDINYIRTTLITEIIHAPDRVTYGLFDALSIEHELLTTTTKLGSFQGAFRADAIRFHLIKSIMEGDMRLLDAIRGVLLHVENLESK